VSICAVTEMKNPLMPDDFVHTVSQRYIELYEKVTGMAFNGTASADIEARVRQNVERYLTEAAGS
jgi:phosphoribosylaminoimidazole-succinocarboxamide synthase